MINYFMSLAYFRILAGRLQGCDNLKKDHSLSKPPPIYCSDELISSLVEASHCSFILLVMRREEKPINVYEIANLLSVEILAAEDLVNILLHFGFIVPIEKGDRYIITQSGIDMLSPKPANSPWHFDPELPYSGDRLPSYVAFDLLPLRIWSYRHRKFSSEKRTN